MLVNLWKSPSSQVLEKLTVQLQNEGHWRPTNVASAGGTTGVWTFMCAMHSLFSPLWYDSPSPSSKSNRACAWLCIGLVRARYTSSEICAKWYHGCSYCLVASESDLDLRHALFPCNLLTFLTQDQAGFVGTWKLYLCAFFAHTLCV